MLNYSKIREYLKKHRQNSILHKILTGAAAVVVFVTTYALILPAITLETKPACGIEEHKHNELDCYANGGEITCQLLEHTHTEVCYPAEEIIASISNSDAIVNESVTEEVPAEEVTTDEMPTNVSADTLANTVSSNETSADSLITEDVSSNDLSTETVSDGDVSGGDIIENSSEENPLIEKRYTDGKVVITALYEEAAEIPEEAQLVAYQVTAENAPERYAKRQEETKAALEAMKGGAVQNVDGTTSDTASEESQKEYLIYNIGFYVDGKEIEPTDKVNITIQFLSEDGFAVGDPITIVHFTEEGTETIKGTDVAQDEEGELTTSFDMSSFSDIAIVAEENGGIETYAANNERRTVTNATGFASAIKDPGFNGTIVIGEDFEIFTNSEESGLTLDNGRDVTIDLNGHRIEVEGALVVIAGDAKLEIIDSVDSTVDRDDKLNVVDDPQTKQPALHDYDRTATYTYDDNRNTGTLTYYVTETAVKEGSTTGATQETLVKYTVTGKGIITGTASGKSVFDVTGGTLTIKSGMIAGSTHRAVWMDGGILNLEGGYLCGNNIPDNADGGAVQAANSIINLSGTVIAGNRAFYGGGIQVTTGAKLNITSTPDRTPVITGNVATGRGGGIDAWECEITMNGGYITNNESTEGYDYSGGGGIYLRGEKYVASPKMTMSGGYITGNKAKSGGGGIFAAGPSEATLVMTGGFVTANYAELHEGGGICIEYSCMGLITGGYITNNITDSEQHWGGGGIFIAERATCQLRSVLVTENNAGGFGGGVAGCSTGRIYMSAIDHTEKGAAIYENQAQGTQLSGGDSLKQQDHVFGKESKVFMENGFDDYFCMLYSNITDLMLGGGSEGWTGSIDGEPVEFQPGERKVGNSVAGLIAHPSDVHMEDAEDEVAEQNGVYINGNYSYTHGGGILCNGYMVLGALEPSETLELAFGTRIELAGVKEFYTSAGVPKTMVGKEFNFILREETTEIEVARATNDENGELIFDRRLVFYEEELFEEERTYRYILAEESAGVGILTDETKYLIEVKVAPIIDYGYISTLDDQGGIIEQAIKKSIFHLKEVNVYKRSSDSSEWELIRTITETEMAGKEENSGIVVDLRNNDNLTTFANYEKPNETEIKVVKEWAGDTVPEGIASVTVGLYRDDVKIDEKVLSREGIEGNPAWTYTWKNLQIRDSDNNGEHYYIYSVKEEAIKDTQGKIITGYLAEYEYSSSANNNAYWVPVSDDKSLQAGNQYMIVSPDGNTALYMLKKPNPEYGFDEKDTLNISQAIVGGDEVHKALGYGDGNITIYDANKITDLIRNNANPDYQNPGAIVFLAQKYKDNVVLKNGGYFDSWIQVYGDENWGSTTERSVSYASFFEYKSGRLYGHIGHALSDNPRPITYDRIWYTANQSTGQKQYGETMFTVSRDVTSTNAVKLYTLARTVSGGMTTVTITNTPIDEAVFTLELTKYGGYIDENDESKELQIIKKDGVEQVLADAKFQIFRVVEGEEEEELLNFSVEPNQSYKYLENAETGSTTTLITNANGKIKVVGMEQGDYILREIESPRGYEKVEDTEFTLNEETYNATHTFKIIDPIIEYELPDTGGEGTLWYTMAGLLLISSAFYLMYKKEKRRREGQTSP